LKRVCEDIKRNFTRNVNVKKLFMVPTAPPADKPNRINGFPFSENFVT